MTWRTAEEYMALARKLCDQYGHDWSRHMLDNVVQCDDCGALGDVIVREGGSE